MIKAKSRTLCEKHGQGVVAMDPWLAGMIKTSHVLFVKAWAEGVAMDPWLTGDMHVG